MDDGKCVDADDKDMFFPSTPAGYTLAVTMFCMHCPVAKQCDDWATANKIQWGIWGGKKRGKNDS